jgi:hypothetical protein
MYDFNDDRVLAGCRILADGFWGVQDRRVGLEVLVPPRIPAVDTLRGSTQDIGLVVGGTMNSGFPSKCDIRAEESLGVRDRRLGFGILVPGRIPGCI